MNPEVFAGSIKALVDAAVELRAEEIKRELLVSLKGEKGDKGEPGESIVGPPGEKGEKGDPGESIIGPPGASGEKGEPGESIIGPAGRDGIDGKDGRDGIDGKDGKGERGTDGKDGRDGRDGIGEAELRALFERMEEKLLADLEKKLVDHMHQSVKANGRSLSFLGHDVQLLGIQWKDVWRASTEYMLGDCVTWGGSMWMCVVDKTTDKPETSDHWKLVVKRGRDGRDRTDKRPTA